MFGPHRNWSASGQVKTLNRPLRVREAILADGSSAFACDGAPSDCVALPLLGFVDKVDLVVSGINPYSNIGHDVTYSGTVTAAMEAVIMACRGSPFHSPHRKTTPEEVTDYSHAAHIARLVTQKAIEDGMPEGFVLNVNTPYLSMDAIKGFTITRQGLRLYRDALGKRIDPRGQPYYWIGGDAPTGPRSSACS